MGWENPRAEVQDRALDIGFETDALDLELFLEPLCDSLHMVGQE